MERNARTKLRAIFYFVLQNLSTKNGHPCMMSIFRRFYEFVQKKNWSVSPRISIS